METRRIPVSSWIPALAVACMVALAGCSPARPPVSTSIPSPADAACASSPDFAALARSARLSVVQVEVSGSRTLGDGDDEAGDKTGRELRDLFKGRHGPALPPTTVLVKGQGSGFVIGVDGVILTNAHVVHGADSVVVRLPDRREFAARVLGADLVTDVAVLKIEAHQLSAVQLGDPGELQPGDWVLAIGAPFGFDSTVTAGLVSATRRALPDQPAVRFIQTDVPINPGNSGGPLFNRLGHVVGINAQIYSTSGGFEGLSFAIPIDVAQQAALQIIATGRAEHGSLGVVAQDLDTSLASAFHLAHPEGALLARIEHDGPADRSGLRSGDVVLAIDRHPVVTTADLSSAVALQRPGDHVQLAFWRDGAAREIQVTLGDGSRAAAPSRRDPSTDAADAAGLVLRALPDETESRDRRGLLVAQVSGRAARAGIQADDILLAINGRSVESPANAVAKLGPGAVALLLRRGDAEMYVALAPAAAARP
jgi:serine protease Do